MDWITKWVMVLWTFLLNIFTVPDDDYVCNLCLALINRYCVQYAIKNLILIWYHNYQVMIVCRKESMTIGDSDYFYCRVLQLACSQGQPYNHHLSRVQYSSVTVELMYLILRWRVVCQVRLRQADTLVHSIGRPQNSRILWQVGSVQCVCVCTVCMYHLCPHKCYHDSNVTYVRLTKCYFNCLIVDN